MTRELAQLPTALALWLGLGLAITAAPRAEAAGWLRCDCNSNEPLETADMCPVGFRAFLLIGTAPFGCTSECCPHDYDLEGTPSARFMAGYDFGKDFPSESNPGIDLGPAFYNEDYYMPDSVAVVPASLVSGLVEYVYGYGNHVFPDGPDETDDRNDHYRECYSGGFALTECDSAHSDAAKSMREAFNTPKPSTPKKSEPSWVDKLIAVFKAILADAPGAADGTSEVGKSVSSGFRTGG